MADVERQAGEVAEVAGHAEEPAEAEVAHDGAVVVVDVVGQTLPPGGGQDAFEQGVFAQAQFEVEVVGAVVEEAGDDAGAKQPHAGDGGKQERGGAEHGEGFELVGGGGRIQHGATEMVGKGVADENGKQHGHDDVAKHGHALRADYVNQ